MDDFTKMCDCPEIQDGWEPKVGNWFVSASTGDCHLIVGDTGDPFLTGKHWYRIETGCDTVVDMSTWLPTIEQLMEMADQGDLPILLFKFNDWMGLYSST
ncbi:hypothetical protein LCGC14_2169610, partial [marine sediment metagenome]